MNTPLQDDYDAPGLRAEARKTKNAGQARRLLALAKGPSGPQGRHLERATRTLHPPLDHGSVVTYAKWSAQ
jgi:hypothetical protein